MTGDRAPGRGGLEVGGQGQGARGQEASQLLLLLLLLFDYRCVVPSWGKSSPSAPWVRASMRLRASGLETIRQTRKHEHGKRADTQTRRCARARARARSARVPRT